MSTITIIRPDYSDPLWEALSWRERESINRIIDVFSRIPEKNNGRTEYLQRMAKVLDTSYPTLRRKFDLYRENSDWRTLARKNTTGAAAKTRAKQPAFIAELLRRVDNHKRKNLPAFRELWNDWETRKCLIPGYEDWPGWPAMPIGWSERNLNKLVQENQSKGRQVAMRIGTSSKSNPHLPTVLTTRVGLWPGAIIQIDDMWHDNYVSYGPKREICRVIELGALDVFSACRFHFGAKVRKGRETIGGADMRVFTAGMFHSIGYSPRGTMIMSEHATAKITEDMARVLYDSTNGLIRVDYQPIEGKQAALTGFWKGTEGGNFRAKALLESTHNPIHNALGNLPMQTGSPSSGIKGPVVTEHIRQYIEKIVSQVLEKVPHRAHLLRLPVLDFHTQFYPFIVDYYDLGLNGRTDHDLEGWAALGNIVNEYTLSPGSGQFFSEDTFLALPPSTQLMLGENVRHAPQQGSRRRNLSPEAAWNRREELLPIPPVAICQILGQDLAREVTSRRGFLTFEDSGISEEPLVYYSRYCSGPMAGREIPAGEKVLMFALPFSDRTALVQDAHGRFLGEVELYKRIVPIEPKSFITDAPFESRPEIRSQALKEAAGEKHSRIADILEPARIVHQAEVLEAKEIRRHNKEVLIGAPVTPEEKKAAKSSGSTADIIRRRRTAECPF